MYSPRGVERRHLPQAPHPSKNAWHKILSQSWLHIVLALCVVVLLAKLCKVKIVFEGSDPEGISSSSRTPRQPEAAPGPVLVSYSYFEKDEVQAANMEFFVAVGMGMSEYYSRPPSTDFVVVISGDYCNPCSALMSFVDLKKDPRVDMVPALASAHSFPGLALLKRKDNEGMDFAAHNVTIEWMRQTGQSKKYRYYVFLNSSVRGPFYPSYMPAGWHWPRAFTDRLRGRVKVVASSLVCLPDIDAGGFGPKVESWALALDKEGLELLARAGVFETRKCKLCRDGVVVLGEYGISSTVLRAGYNIATLMSMYSEGVEWSDDRHWHCNNNAHPSRHGTYDGISMHPFETVFIKASWHVGEPHLSHYTQWFMAHSRGSANTDGYFEEPMYQWAITPEAQEPNNAEECFRVLPSGEHQKAA